MSRYFILLILFLSAEGFSQSAREIKEGLRDNFWYFTQLSESDFELEGKCKDYIVCTLEYIKLNVLETKLDQKSAILRVIGLTQFLNSNEGRFLLLNISNQEFKLLYPFMIKFLETNNIKLDSSLHRDIVNALINTLSDHLLEDINKTSRYFQWISEPSKEIETKIIQLNKTPLHQNVHESIKKIFYLQEYFKEIEKLQELSFSISNFMNKKIYRFLIGRIDIFEKEKMIKKFFVEIKNFNGLIRYNPRAGDKRRTNLSSICGHNLSKFGEKIL